VDQECLLHTRRWNLFAARFHAIDNDKRFERANEEEVAQHFR
jgi:hypothetical protein